MQHKTRLRFRRKEMKAGDIFYSVMQKDNCLDFRRYIIAEMALDNILREYGE